MNSRNMDNFENFVASPDTAEQNRRMFNKLRALFIAELLMIPTVGFIFWGVPDRFRAGMITGTLFIALGAWIFISGVRSSQFRRMWTFYLGCIHLFVIALPMVANRLLNSSTAFQEARIWGMPGPVFHQVSTWLYSGLVLITLIEMIRARLSERRVQA